MNKKVEYNEKEFIVVDELRIDGVESLILLEDNYVLDYQTSGIDTESGILKIDNNPYKIYPNKNAVHCIIDNKTGIGVGFYGIAKEDIR